MNTVRVQTSVPKTVFYCRQPPCATLSSPLTHHRLLPFLPRRFPPVHRWCRRVLLTALLLSGCEGKTGEVRRTVSISHPLSVGTITEAMASVPGVRLVEQSVDGPVSGHAFFSGSLEAADGLVCAYDDDAELVNGLLSVRRAGHESYLLTLSKTWAELPPPPGAMQKTRLLMDRVYGALRQRDPALPPASEIKEELFGPKPPS